MLRTGATPTQAKTNSDSRLPDQEEKRQKVGTPEEKVAKAMTGRKDEPEATTATTTTTTTTTATTATTATTTRDSPTPVESASRQGAISIPINDRISSEESRSPAARCCSDEACEALMNALKAGLNQMVVSGITYGAKAFIDDGLAQLAAAVAPEWEPYFKLIINPLLSAGYTAIAHQLTQLFTQTVFNYYLGTETFKPKGREREKQWAEFYSTSAVAIICFGMIKPLKGLVAETWSSAGASMGASALSGVTFMTMSDLIKRYGPGSFAKIPAPDKGKVTFSEHAAKQWETFRRKNDFRRNWKEWGGKVVGAFVGNLLNTTYSAANFKAALGATGAAATTGGLNAMVFLSAWFTSQHLFAAAGGDAERIRMKETAITAHQKADADGDPELMADDVNRLIPQCYAFSPVKDHSALIVATNAALAGVDAQKIETLLDQINECADEKKRLKDCLKSTSQDDDLKTLLGDFLDFLTWSRDKSHDKTKLLKKLEKLREIPHPKGDASSAPGYRVLSPDPSHESTSQGANWRAPKNRTVLPPRRDRVASATTKPAPRGQEPRANAVDGAPSDDSDAGDDGSHPPRVGGARRRPLQSRGPFVRPPPNRELLEQQIMADMQTTLPAGANQNLYTLAMHARLARALRDSGASTEYNALATLIEGLVFPEKWTDLHQQLVTAVTLGEPILSEFIDGLDRTIRQEASRVGARNVSYLAKMIETQVKNLDGGINWKDAQSVAEAILGNDSRDEIKGMLRDRIAWRREKNFNRVAALEKLMQRLSQEPATDEPTVEGRESDDDD